MLGAILALLGACFHGTNNASLRRGVLTGSVSQALSITITLGVPFSFLAAWLSGQLFQFGELGTRGVLFAGTAGILQYVWGRYWNYSATKYLGSVGSGPIQQSQMWIAVFLAIVLLDETMTPLKLAGMGLIFIAPFIIARSLRLRRLQNERLRAEQLADGKKVEILFDPKIWVGYGCAVLAAIGYGISPVVVRAGLGDSGLGLLGGMIAYWSAFLTFWTISVLVPGQIKHIREVSKQSRKWYMFAGVMTYCGQACYFVALSIAPVTVVAPLFQISLIVRVIAGYILNRKYEVLTRLSLLAILLAFCGTLLISLDLALNA